MSNLYGVNEFEAANKNLELIETFGPKNAEVKVYLNKDDSTYYAKGAFARYETDCYLKLPGLDDNGIQEWIKKMKSLNPYRNS